MNIFPKRNQIRLPLLYLFVLPFLSLPLPTSSKKSDAKGEYEKRSRKSKKKSDGKRVQKRIKRISLFGLGTVALLALFYFRKNGEETSIEIQKTPEKILKYPKRIL